MSNLNVTNPLVLTATVEGRRLRHVVGSGYVSVYEAGQPARRVERDTQRGAFFELLQQLCRAYLLSRRSFGATVRYFTPRNSWFTDGTGVARINRSVDSEKPIFLDPENNYTHYRAALTVGNL